MIYINHRKGEDAEYLSVEQCCSDCFSAITGSVNPSGRVWFWRIQEVNARGRSAPACPARDEDNDPNRLLAETSCIIEVNTAL